jgi:hypothetical protein
VLTAKALLKEAGLNEVFTGGLSSYSLLNMALAHLQAEGLAPDARPARATEAALLGQEAQAAFLASLEDQVGGGVAAARLFAVGIWLFAVGKGGGPCPPSQVPDRTGATPPHALVRQHRLPATAPAPVD